MRLTDGSKYSFNRLGYWASVETERTESIGRCLTRVSFQKVTRHPDRVFVGHDIEYRQFVVGTDNSELAVLEEFHDLAENLSMKQLCHTAIVFRRVAVAYEKSQAQLPFAEQAA